MGNRLAKREKHAALAYQLRTLERRRRELRKEFYITIELEKPLFAGYEKFFIFRSDVLARPDFPILEKLLPLINTVLTSKHKHFTKRVKRKSKQATKEKGKKTIDVAHKIKDLEVRDWEKLSLKEQTYFSPTTIKMPHTNKLITVYRWNYTWMLVSKIRKKYITSIRVPNPTIESESDHIENYIKRHNLGGKIGKIIYGHHKWKAYNSTKMRYRQREKDIWKEVRKELEFLDPSVYPPFLDDFSIKTVKPNYSFQNSSALLFFSNATFRSRRNLPRPEGRVTNLIKIINCI